MSGSCCVAITGKSTTGFHLAYKDWSQDAPVLRKWFFLSKAIAMTIVGLLVIPLITLFGAFSVGPKGSGKNLSKFDLAFMSAYACGTLITALLIFRGVRKESIITLQLSGILLVLFQMGASVTMVLFWKGSRPTNRGQPEVLRIVSVIVNVICSVTYLFILVCYIRHIRRKQRGDFVSETDSF